MRFSLYFWSFLLSRFTCCVVGCRKFYAHYILFINCVVILSFFIQLGILILKSNLSGVNIATLAFLSVSRSKPIFGSRTPWQSKRISVALRPAALAGVVVCPFKVALIHFPSRKDARGSPGTTMRKRRWMAGVDSHGHRMQSPVPPQEGRTDSHGCWKYYQQIVLCC